MTGMRKLVACAVVCLTCALAAAETARASLIEITIADFVLPEILDFEGLPTGNVTGTEAVFVDFGLSSISGSGVSDFQDAFGVRSNSSRALWADVGGLAIVDPGETALANFHTYELVFQNPIMKFGFGTHDQGDVVDYIRVSTFLGATSVSTISLGAGLDSDLNMFYLADDANFDGVVIESLGNSGFAIDNLTVDTPEASSLWLMGSGLLGVFLWRRRLRGNAQK